MQSQPTLAVNDITKNYGKKKALRSISLSVEKGKILCILGPSGSGKSTLLRLIAGLEVPSSGDIIINGNNQKGVPPQKRDVGFVFQTTEAVFPHMTVKQNISFPLELKIRKDKTKDLPIKVNRMIDLVGLTPYVKQYPDQLSGGEQQRISIARSLIYEPSLLLLDEPLSSLDNILKRELIDTILEIRKRFQPTILYVTHDEREALELADSIAILNEGAILQLDSPKNVSSNPASTKVAEIIGGWNIFEADCEKIDGQYHFTNSSFHFILNNVVVNTRRVNIGIPVSALEVLHKSKPISEGELIFFPVSTDRIISRGGDYLVSVLLGNILIRFETKIPLKINDDHKNLSLKVPKSAIKIWERN